MIISGEDGRSPSNVMAAILLGWPKIHQKSKMNLLPIPYGYLGIIDWIYVREIRIPSKSCSLKQPENGPELKKVDFQQCRNNMLLVV